MRRYRKFIRCLRELNVKWKIDKTKSAMEQERWQQVRNIFDGALEHAPDERLRFLDEVCANDEEVRREVESLLSSFDNAENFMETPAVAKVADIIEAET